MNLLILLGLSVLCSCQTKTTEQTANEEVVVSNQQDEDKVKINETLEKMVEETYPMYGDCFDFLEYSLDKRLDWMSNCTRQFIQYYNEQNQSKTQLSDSLKVDWVRTEIANYYLKTLHGCSADMAISSAALSANLEYYVLTRYSKALNMSELSLPFKNSLQKEMECWNKFSLSYKTFICNLIDLDFWGGSGAGSTSDFETYSFLKKRADSYNDDIRLIEDSYFYIAEGVYLKEIEDLFYKCLDKTVAKLPDPNHIPEYIDRNPQGYKNSIIESLKLSKQLKLDFREWLDSRLAVSKYYENKNRKKDYLKNTSNLIGKLAAQISSTMEYGFE